MSVWPPDRMVDANAPTASTESTSTFRWSACKRLSMRRLATELNLASTHQHAFDVGFPQRYPVRKTLCRTRLETLGMRPSLLAFASSEILTFDKYGRSTSKRVLRRAVPSSLWRLTLIRSLDDGTLVKKCTGPSRRGKGWYSVRLAEDKRTSGLRLSPNSGTCFRPNRRERRQSCTPLKSQSVLFCPACP